MESSNSILPDYVKVKELESIFVNSQGVTPFCISWSKDDKMSVIVEGGVFVYELWPTPLSNQQTVAFFKTWIPAHTSALLSNAVVDNENGSFLWGLERKQAYEACIDTTLSYAVQKTNTSSGVSQVIQCEFSPLIGCRSYLSCLTNNGDLQIYVDTLKKWTPVMNVTQLWISHCNFKESQKKKDFNSFKSEMFKLKIITMKWVEEPYITFITGHENGDIVFWKVDILNENFGMSVKFTYSVTGKPVYLYLSRIPCSDKSHLFIGKLSGIVSCYSIDLSTEIIHENFYFWKYEDFIAPNLITTKYLDNKLFVFSIKRHLLIWQTASLNELNQLEIMETHWEEFSTAVTSWNEYQDSFVISLQNHDVYLLSLRNNKNLTFEKKLIDLEIKKKQKNSYCCYGLTMSQNKAIWVLVSSPKQSYDSLKEITHLILYTPEIKVFGSLINYSISGLIENILKEFKCIQLNEIFDLLALKKLELLKDFSKFKTSYYISEALPLVFLQLLLWEIKLKLFCNLMESDSLVAELELAITKNRAEKVIQNFQKCDSLTLMQKKSLDICQMFVMNIKERDRSLDVMCSICGCECFCYNIRVSSCSNLHKFPRCCLSLLPCDTVPYAVCKFCESVALINFVVEGDNRCPYCDGLLELDTRFHSVV